MNQFEKIVLLFQKKFKGEIVTDYPGKGFPLSQVETVIWEGFKPVNPSPVGEQINKINRRFNK